MKLLSILLAAIVIAVSADSEVRQAPSAHSCVCGKASYNNKEIVASVNKGYSVNSNPTSPRGYPHKFNNREKLVFPWCTGGTYIEYPLKTGAPFSGQGSPGADRVVYLQGPQKTFCGCMTHTGAKTPNGFVLCANH